jgi:transposase
MDKLHNRQKDLVQEISFQHTKSILGSETSVVFYDVTTIYFEIDNEDGLKKTGFSKEGKHQNPQIVLGLLVGKNGYPLAYDIFEGSKFEGHTMLPIKVYKELERQLKEKKSKLSPEKVIEIIQSIYQIEITAPKNKEVIKSTLMLTKEHKLINELFDFGC